MRKTQEPNAAFRRRRSILACKPSTFAPAGTHSNQEAPGGDTDRCRRTQRSAGVIKLMDKYILLATAAEEIGARKGIDADATQELLLQAYGIGDLLLLIRRPTRQPDGTFKFEPLPPNAIDFSPWNSEAERRFLFEHSTINVPVPLPRGTHRRVAPVESCRIFVSRESLDEFAAKDQSGRKESTVAVEAIGDDLMLSQSAPPSLETAISVKSRDAQPGPDKTWKQFCDEIRDQCDGWTNKHNGKAKRGYGDKTIKRKARKLRDKKAV
jgi:hypothetical protein